MNELEQIKALLRAATDADEVEIYSGTVVRVDEGNATCVVKMINELEVPVRLRSIETDQTGLVLVPKVGSEITFADVSGCELVMINASELEKLWVKIGNADVLVTNGEITGKVGDTVHKMTGQTHQINTGQESMKNLLTDLLDAIMNATYTNGAGTTFVADNLSTFQQIAQRIPKLLN